MRNTLNQLFPAPAQTVKSAALAAGVALALAGCATQPGYTPAPVASYPAANAPVTTYPSGNYPAGTYPSAGQQRSYSEYGRVSNVELIQTQTPGQTSGAGAIIGGIAGGVVGNQVGGGTGRDVARIAGIAGGALLGNAIEKNRNVQTVDTYRVTVQVDNSGARTYDFNTSGDLRVGDRVRIDNGQLSRY